MKELLIFRTFALFPLIGILIPDIANRLDSSLTSIPVEHLIVEITLSICVLVCSAGIWAAEEVTLQPTPLRNKLPNKHKRHPQLAMNIKKDLQIAALKPRPNLAK